MFSHNRTWTLGQQPVARVGCGSSKAIATHSRTHSYRRQHYIDGELNLADILPRHGAASIVQFQLIVLSRHSEHHTVLRKEQVKVFGLVGRPVVELESRAVHPFELAGRRADPCQADPEEVVLGVSQQTADELEAVPADDGESGPAVQLQAGVISRRPWSCLGGEEVSTPAGRRRSRAAGATLRSVFWPRRRQQISIFYHP